MPFDPPTLPLFRCSVVSRSFDTIDPAISGSSTAELFSRRNSAIKAGFATSAFVSHVQYSYPNPAHLTRNIVSLTFLFGVSPRSARFLAAFSATADSIRAPFAVRSFGLHSGQCQTRPSFGGFFRGGDKHLYPYIASQWSHMSISSALAVHRPS